ncbi:type VII toxin-antitoxin system HepT family RNase toxin [Nitrosomonas marina]|uniref:Uncharacterized conserved protein YutE, UPF0331/DUF86 family n=1 Tax=Nitrosomonas marina TaxID=917 RepID=A0A1H8FG60_9PROT|nr:DUF86 domain-containing protein [Nitrosomonas marina]SEN30616.1 Uncharacterized conserved protein YutE, UPF0331/DUF86 family [Nitrosomonas marina]
MADDVLLIKTAAIHDCVARAREAYLHDPVGFSNNDIQQDTAILNIQRANEAVLDIGKHLVRREKLGSPHSAHDVFILLAKAGWISGTLAATLQNMIGFRSIAVHGYQSPQLAVTIAIIEHHLDAFLLYSKTVLSHDVNQY